MSQPPNLPQPYTQYPPPPNHPDFYDQYRKEDVTDHSIYDVNYKPNPCRTFKNRFPLVVDSRDRNSGTIDNYNYNIDNVIYDVIAVELKLADIPNSAYLINTHNNQFYFQDTQAQVCNSEFYQVTIPVGNYFADSTQSISIRALLEAGMNQSSNGSTYSVTVSRHTNKFTIRQVSGSGFFNIIFIDPAKISKPENPCKAKKAPTDDCQKDSRLDCQKDVGIKVMPNLINNTMDILLGFSKRNLTGRNEYTSDLSFNLKHDKYVVLRIENDGHVWRRIISNNSALKDAFTVIPISFNLNNFNFIQDLNNLNNEFLIMNFKEPIKVGKLKITFTNRDGHPIDFNGQDHLLVFEVTSLSRFDNYH